MTKKYERSKSLQRTDVMLRFFFIFTKTFTGQKFRKIKRLFLGTSCAKVLQDITELFFSFGIEMIALELSIKFLI